MSYKGLKQCKEIFAINSRIVGINKQLKVEEKDGIIVRIYDNINSISINDEIYLSAFNGGQEICSIPSPFKVKKIEKCFEANIRFRIITHERNLTTNYITPIIFDNMEFVKYESHLVNSYLISDTQLAMVYRYMDTDNYCNLIRDLSKSKLFCSSMNIEGYDVLIFDIPEQYETDVWYFRQGKYSKFSKKLKDRILKFYGSSLAKPVKVVNKDKSLEKELLTLIGLNSLYGVDFDKKPCDENDEFILQENFESFKQELSGVLSTMQG